MVVKTVDSARISPPIHAGRCRDPRIDATLDVLRHRFGEQPVLVRQPAADPVCPQNGDLDIIVFGQVRELLPERLTGLTEHLLQVDVIHLPQVLLSDPDTLARQGVLAHRILTSQPLSQAGPDLAAQLERMHNLMYVVDVQKERITGFLQLGADTVREVGVTRDLPELALFWLHMSYVAALVSLADSQRILCPNIYTRPFDFVDPLQKALTMNLRSPALELLRLNADPTPLPAILRRLHQQVSETFPEPTWPEAMRQCTRYEYRYFSSQEEIEWRIRIAEELIAGGQPEAAVFYLRFVAYMLARIPMVFHRAREGLDVSFIRPQRAVYPDLERHCPQILDDLREALGGGEPVSSSHLNAAVSFVNSLRRKCLEKLQQQNIHLTGIEQWQPYCEPLDRHSPPNISASFHKENCHGYP
ncbi:MAG: hypothetical protein BMS9Abin06_0081 [Gammaproteobacteria bacterium]|nr:MAG: hypothetical protein BMS9Abin06_0081 [Gammaproteobacteria bacterium]